MESGLQNARINEANFEFKFNSYKDCYRCTVLDMLELIKREPQAKTETPSMHRGLGSATLSQLAFPREGKPNFPWKKSHWDNTLVKTKNKTLSTCMYVFLSLFQLRTWFQNVKF